MRLSDRFLALVLLGMIVVMGLSYWGRPDGMSTETRALTDSLRVTAPAFEDSMRASAKREAVYVTQADRSATRASIVTAHAEELKRVADSLALVAQQSGEWQSAYVARTTEADSLRVAAVSWESAFASERAGRIEADYRADEEKARRGRLTLAVSGLKADLANATRRRWWDRISVGPSYSATVAEGRVYVGPGASATFRVWP